MRKILIVGAGPSGLSLALALHERGIPARVVDRLPQGLNTSRAVGVHARTLEVLEPFGVSAALVDEGIHATGLSMREHDRELARLSTRQIPSRYPYVLLIPQERTEAILEARLRALGGSVERGTSFVGMQRGGAARWRVRLERAGKPEAYDCDYVVAADGMHSSVREAAGIPFVGAAYEMSFVLADVTLSWPIAEKVGCVFFSDEGILLVVPLPNGHFRMVATLDPAPEDPDLALMRELMARRGPTGAEVDELFWSSRFRVHHRLAETFVRDGVLLIGDAAHVHSPVGGQGMNLGIRDAISLAAALAQGSPEALQRWNKDRRRRARAVIRTTDPATRLIVNHAAWMRPARHAVLAAASWVPGLFPWIAKRLAGLHDLAGLPAPPHRLDDKNFSRAKAA